MFFVFPSIHPSTITSQHLYKCVYSKGYRIFFILQRYNTSQKKDSEHFLVSTQNLKSTTNASSPFSCASNATLTNEIANTTPIKHFYTHMHSYGPKSHAKIAFVFFLPCGMLLFGKLNIIEFFSSWALWQIYSFSFLARAAIIFVSSVLSVITIIMMIIMAILYQSHITNDDNGREVSHVHLNFIRLLLPVTVTLQKYTDYTVVVFQSVVSCSLQSPKIYYCSTCQHSGNEMWQIACSALPSHALF